jgi:hypothetical protein
MMSMKVNRTLHVRSASFCREPAPAVDMGVDQPWRNKSSAGFDYLPGIGRVARSKGDAAATSVQPTMRM